LGYVSVKYIRGVKSNEAYFISRLKSGTKIYELKNSKYQELKLTDLYKYMRAKGLQRMEKVVFITKELEEVRMIVELMPDDIVEQRLRKAKKEAKKKGRNLSQEYVNACKAKPVHNQRAARGLKCPEYP